MMDKVRMERNAQQNRLLVLMKGSHASMNISLVPLEHAHTTWNDVRHYLEPAVEVQRALDDGASVCRSGYG